MRPEDKKQLIFDFKLSRRGDRDNFTSQLFRLIQKADLQNLDKISKGFPDHVAVWHEWFNSEDEQGFFEKYGVK